MLNLPEFHTSGTLYQSERTLVLRGTDPGGRPVVLKTTRNPAPSALEVSAIRSEYSIGSQISHPAVVEFLGLEQAEHRPVLVMEDFDAEALAGVIKRESLSPERALRLGIAVAEALSALHSNGINHKDVNPANILISRDGQRVKLADFSIASLLRREGQRAGGAPVLEGTISYLSPEQTGRTNRYVDYRADFYSLGVTLYELLAGRLPFDADDPAEMLHAHVARPPLSLSGIRQDLPDAVSAVVMKLLAKTPEERYQSSAGLIHDLERCLKILDGADPGDFELGSRDSGARFAVPGRLYGRSKERRWLTAALERAAEGSRVLALLSGASGIGKSALVRELQPEVASRRGRFAMGKHRSDQRAVPHSAFIQAMGELVNQALSSTEQDLRRLRRKLLECLGEEARTLAEMVPGMLLLLGDDLPEPVHLTADAAEARLHRLVEAFLSCFASASSPLVLFFGNLQWADAASLQLLEMVLASDDLHYLLVLATVRDEDTLDLLELDSALEGMRQGSAEVSELAVAPLDQEAVTRLIADSTHTDPEQVEPLARLIRQKTMGNPLFITQLLQSLHARELLTYQPERGSWSWDLAQVEKVGVTDDMVELLMDKMRALPVETRELLELASLVGGRFDLGTLALLAELPLTEVVEHLHQALEAGIITPVCGGFSHLVNACSDHEHCDGDGWSQEQVMQVQCDFHHDRIQQAAYLSLPEQRRPGLHHRLGRLLVANLDAEALGKRLFEVVGHLNQGIELLEDRAERTEAARLNLQAAVRAMESGGKSTARAYFDAGVGLLPDDIWTRDHQLAFELHLGHYECSVLTEEDPHVVLARGEALLERAEGLTQRMRAMIPHVPQLASRGRQPELCLERGAALLREAGIELLPDDVEAAIERGHAELTERLKGREIEDLAHLPRGEDPLIEAATNLLETLFFFPIYMRRRDLGPLAALQSIRLSLEHGNGPLSGVAYATWGMVLASDRGELREGRRFCQLGMTVSDALGSRQAMTRIIVGTLEWAFRNSVEMAEWWSDCYRMAARTGVEFVQGIALSSGHFHELLAGRPLEEWMHEARINRETIDRRMPIIGPRELDYSLRFAETLLGLRSWKDLLFDSEQELEQAFEVMRVRNLEGVQWTHLLRSRLCLMFGDAAAALSEAEASENIADRRVSQTTAYELVVHHALAMAAVADTAEAGERAQLMEQIREKLVLLIGWVEGGAGARFEHQRQLVEAELARLEGRYLEAGQAYDTAIASAAEGRYLPMQALAAERAGLFYTGHGLDRVALTYLRDSHYCYDRWGAAAKVQALEECFPELAAPVAASATEIASETTSSSTGSTAAQRFDLLTILKATQQISREVELDALLQQLLASIMELGSAERGFLVLALDGELTVGAARSTRADEDLSEAAGAGLDECDALSVGITQYVARTGEAVVLAEAAQKGRFRADPYVSRTRPRSMACIPLMNQGTLVGLAYLENNMVGGAFGEERLELVYLLCDQAAISIQNAHLYGQLERRVQERTRDLAHKNEELGESLERQQEMQNQLIMQEKMASLGNLVAGVAHEINTPVGAIASSTDTSRRAVERLRKKLEAATDIAEIRDKRKVWRLVEMLEENHRVVGLASDRVVEIVLSLRNFARLDEAERKRADLNEGITSTLSLVGHRTKHGITVETDLGPLEPILCYPNQLNQVFMNLLTNAIDAVDEQPEGERRIHVRSWMQDGMACVRVADSGSGVPEAVQERVFDPGFTTKGVGVGTGLGLAICYNIVRKHQGDLLLESSPGQGAAFTVRLPVAEG